MGELRNEDVYFETRAEQLLYELERTRGLSRRRLLQLAVAGVPLVAALGRFGAPAARAGAAATSPIVKPLPPEWFVNFGSNAEMRWDAVTDLGYTIPNERFFVRDHTSTPIIDAGSWRLRVFGSGLRGAPDLDHAVEFSYRDLQRLPSRTITTAIECAGNGRSFFDTQQHTPAGGTQWHLGGIGVATWSGVPLSNLLERAGIRRDAVDVMPSGLDPTVVSGGVDVGHVRRPLPVSKALDDAILALKMNGTPLSYDHGFPARFVVPGWVGISSVKWVGQIEVSSQPLFSLWNTTQYVLVGPTYTGAPPVTTQTMKSAFELPFFAEFPVGREQVLTGRSWSANAPITRIEVSVDGGTTWEKARRHGPSIPQAWVRWSFPWTPTSKGSLDLRARAADASGMAQPETVPFNTGGYLFGAIVKHPVTVV
jgi:DMSO/TMAO reductase YedYZ molybdopterin-dependent catalytic subunit